MKNGAVDLQALLDPVGTAHFFAVHWEKEPLHLRRRDAEFYSEVLSIADVERLVASPDARYPAVQLSKGGAYFPAEVYCDDVKFGAENFTGVPNLKKVATEYRAGATIVLPALHRTWAPLKALCAGIESELDHVVHANAYLTPGNTAGFLPHYDTHEVFVLQIAGKKQWRIDEPPIELPHRKQPFNPLSYVLPEKPLLELELEAGDLLYLPRGHIHTTTTSDGYSAHVTIGIAVYTWLDLTSEILQSAMGSLAFRKALPPGFARRRDELPGLRAGLQDRLHTLESEHGGTRLIDLFLSRIRKSAELEPVRFHADAVVIAADTMLAAPAAESFRIVQQGMKVALEFERRRFILPTETLPMLEFMRRCSRFRTVDLPTATDIETKLALVRSLHERGFLSVAPGV